jgi:gamma-glutamylcyclotransferase (GGCT)/AIG2-like uncharacterized protein YtfP
MRSMLFVYGTLQFPEVLHALLGRVPPMTPAVLPGWRAAALPGRVYPGLVAAPGRSAPGMVLADLRPNEVAVLDAFEGSAYERIAVTLADGGVATAYRWRSPDDVSATDWDPIAFAAETLAAYVGRLR